MSRHNEEVPQEHNGVLKLNSRCIFHTGVMLCCAWQLEFVTFFRNHGVAEINGHLAMCKIIADAPDGVHVRGRSRSLALRRARMERLALVGCSRRRGLRHVVDLA